MPIDPIGGFPPQPYQKLVRPMFRTLGIAASGLSAQRQRLETIASNIANAEVTRTEEGGPYRRRVVRMEAQRVEGQPFEMTREGVVSRFRLPTGNPLEHMGGVRVTAIEETAAEGPLVYDPAHPDADAQGYVRMPNVRITDEIVDLMDARRVYEANATVFSAAKSMLRSAINI
jgi:flagellar basal-body rod protein FlgC